MPEDSSLFYCISSLYRKTSQSIQSSFDLKLFECFIYQSRSSQLARSLKKEEAKEAQKKSEIKAK